MVISHSFVSLPEGKPSSYCGSPMGFPLKPVVRHGQASQGQVQGSSEISLEPKCHGKIPWDSHFEVTGKWCFLNETHGECLRQYCPFRNTRRAGDWIRKIICRLLNAGNPLFNSIHPPTRGQTYCSYECFSVSNVSTLRTV